MKYELFLKWHNVTACEEYMSFFISLDSGMYLGGTNDAYCWAVPIVCSAWKQITTNVRVITTSNIAKEVIKYKPQYGTNYVGSVIIIHNTSSLIIIAQFIWKT